LRAPAIALAALTGTALFSVARAGFT